MEQVTKRIIRERGLERNLRKIVWGCVIKDEDNLIFFSGKLKQDGRGFFVNNVGRNECVALVRGETYIFINYLNNLRLYHY